MAVLAEGMLSRFRDRLLQRVTLEYPEQVNELGGQGTRDLIQHGIDWGVEYGIKAERDVCVLIEFMLQFGPELERHPGQPRLGAILKNPRLSGQAKIAIAKTLARPR